MFGREGNHAARAAKRDELIERSRAMFAKAQELKREGRIGNSPELQSALKGLERFIGKPEAFGRQLLAKVHLMTVGNILHEWEIDDYPRDVSPERPL